MDEMFIVNCNEFASLLLFEAIIEWEEQMNLILKRLAQKKWGSIEWFEKLKECLSPTMREHMNIGDPFDAFRIAVMCSAYPRELFPESLKDDSSREAHR